QHCYMDAREKAGEEMTLEEGIGLVDHLAELKIPILILTGGEPLLSRNFYALAFHAREVGLRTVISTNGTLITPEVARLLAEAKIGYVGVSLDSSDPKRHDAFRGVAGAHARALQGLRNARDAGLKTGLRIRQLAGCSGSSQPGPGGVHSPVLPLPSGSHREGGGHSGQGRYAGAAAQRHPPAGGGGRGAQRKEH
ncbi:MAG: radical SAM protein, partial [Methanothrix sp.]